MMPAIAKEPTICVTGTLADAATAIFMLKLRTLLTARSKRRASYSWPPKTFTTRWQPIDSSSTWLRSPIAACSARLIARRRFENLRMISTISGPTSSDAA